MIYEGTMDKINTEQLTITEVRHFPVVKHYAKRLRLVETINEMVPSEMELSPGVTVLAMVHDTLSGRSPLYRLAEFFDEKDTELLLGESIDPWCFNDTNVGRAMDRIYEKGTLSIFSKISQTALVEFGVDARRLNFDTTSVSVYGDYMREEEDEPPFKITYGYSKDKRPDLKQFLISMLCVDRNIPIFGATKDGNASDKTLNNELLTQISKHMANHGLCKGAYVYVSDSALVSEANFMEAEKNGTRVLSRLPATYNECARAIDEAVAAGKWEDVGTLANDSGSEKRPLAHYKTQDVDVALFGKTYRAIVVHSSAYDKRRHKKIDRAIENDYKELEKLCKNATAIPFFCEKDAKAAADKLVRSADSAYHALVTDIKEIPKYGRGRPVKGQPRIITGYDYVLSATIRQVPEKTELLRRKAGCFVLITNITDTKTWPSDELLALYKSQIGIEKNFGFLKDPVIVNSIFLKKAERIEVLGLVLLIALLIWRLMERSMRLYVEKTGSTMVGWEKRPTKKPTAFMMTTKFSKIMAITMGGYRQLAKPLKDYQLEYLAALDVPIDAFTIP